MRFTEAQVRRIRSLEGSQGEMSARALVADAKKTTSPLHSLFDWNLKRSAEKWWLQRARDIIGQVQIQIRYSHATVMAPAYVFDPSQKEGYRSVMALRDDKAGGVEALRYTLTTAAGHLRRAYDLAAPLGLQGEVDRLLEEIAGVVRKVEEAA